MTEWHLLHPAAVHFPIAFLLVGWLLAAWECAINKPVRLTEAVSWLLWLGTVSVWAALGFGLLAEWTAPHVPPAWETLAKHEALAYWAAGLFTALSLWRLWNWWKKAAINRGWKIVFLTAWLAAAGVLAVTARLGGELVFTYGMGVRQ